MSINSTQARDGELNLNVRIVTHGAVNAALLGDTDDGVDSLNVASAVAVAAWATCAPAGAH